MSEIEMTPDQSRDPIASVCAWCTAKGIYRIKSRATGGDWVDVDEDVYKSMLNKSVSHGMCPECAAEYMDDY